MAFDAFLKLDGIKGEGPGGAITLESFSWGVSNTSSQSTGGAGAGKAVFQDFSFTAILGAEAPDLFSAAVRGEHIRTGTLTISDKTPVLVIKFDDVLISSYKLDEGPLSLKLRDASPQNDVQLGPPTERVSFNFAKFVFQTGGSVASGDISGNIG
jgi:type VI protein secretion system component Hcp